MTGQPDADAGYAALSPRKQALLALALSRTQRQANPAAERPDEDGDPPASYEQRHLWYLAALRPESCAYLVPVEISLRGRLDAVALADALGVLVDRHLVLRTVLVESAGIVRQRLRPAQPVRLPVTDLRGSDAQARLAQLRAEQLATPFDLRTEPPLRAVLVRTGEQEHALILVLHHIACDGWSLGVLVRELAEVYAALRAGERLDLPTLTASYPEYARAQRDRFAGGVLEQRLAGWRELLSGAPPLWLPVDHPPAGRAHDPDHGVVPGHGGDRAPADTGSVAGPADALALNLSAELIAALSRTALHRRATPFMALLAAFALTLARCGDQRDVLLGTAVANRADQQLEPLVGFFANTVPLRVDLSGEPSFHDLLDRVRTHSLAMLDQQDVPYGSYAGVRRAEPVRAMLVLRTTPMTELTLPELAVQVRELPRREAKFALSVELAPTPAGGLTGSVEYRADLFDQASVVELVARWRTTLAAATRWPDRPVWTLPFAATGPEPAGELAGRAVCLRGADGRPTPRGAAGDLYLGSGPIDPVSPADPAGPAGETAQDGTAGFRRSGRRARIAADGTVRMLPAPAEPATGQSGSEPAPHVAPEGPLENALAGLWTRVLGVQSVGATDDFFVLGGHSLLALQVVAAIRDQFGLDVPLEEFLGVTTVREIAGTLRGMGRERGLDVDELAGGAGTPAAAARAGIGRLDRSAYRTGGTGSRP